MPIICHLQIDSVAVVDDNKDGRDTLSDDLSYAHFNPIPLAGPFADLPALMQDLYGKVDAAVLDHHLNTRNYAGCTGAEAAEHLYKKKVPAVVVTSWSDADIGHIRQHRRWVPSLLARDAADPDAISRGFEQCILEFNDSFLQTRKPWRTLVRIEEVRDKEGLVYCVVPAWNSDRVVSFPLQQIPGDLKDKIGYDVRLLAQVNIGAEHQDELYFDEFAPA
jgi:CheY-like chemotaxis protein